MKTSSHLFFHSYGPASAPTIVFLHGGGGAGWMWEPQVERLRTTYHCLVPDLPEHGASLAAGPFSIYGAASQCAALIREHAHGGKAHLVGLSEGAQTGLALLSQAPELVDHAVLSSPLVRPIPGSRFITPGSVALSYRWFMAPFRNSPAWIDLNRKYSAGVPDTYRDQFAATFRSLTKDAFVHVMLENQRFRLPAGLDKVRAPTLVLAGVGEYKAMRQSVKDIAAAIPTARGYLVRPPRRRSLAEQHNWALVEPESFIRTVQAWIENRPLPEALIPING